MKRKIVKPEDFGAVGDGVTDDTEALQRAFDSGLPVNMSGRYWISGPVNMGRRQMPRRVSLLSRLWSRLVTRH